MIGGIIFGSYGEAVYVKAIHDEDLFRPWETVCHLVNYESIRHMCKSCGEDECTFYTCYNQMYKITYLIFNGTYSFFFQLGENSLCWIWDCRD
jgi:hypothetical protein